jgi:hypothetical protein
MAVRLRRNMHSNQYIKATRLQIGLIINFSAAKIPIRRVIPSAKSNAEEGKSGNREKELINQNSLM